jgi:hypothetical protein
MGLRARSDDEIAAWKKEKIEIVISMAKSAICQLLGSWFSELHPTVIDTIAFDIWDVSKLKTPWTKLDT